MKSQKKNNETNGRRAQLISELELNAIITNVETDNHFFGMAINVIYNLQVSSVR